MDSNFRNPIFNNVVTKRFPLGYRHAVWLLGALFVLGTSSLAHAYSIESPYYGAEKDLELNGRNNLATQNPQNATVLNNQTAPRDMRQGNDQNANQRATNNNGRYGASNGTSADNSSKSKGVPLNQNDLRALPHDKRDQFLSLIATNPRREKEEIQDLQAKGNLLLIYGDDTYERFLGCLNCAPNYFISVWNTSGPYGSPLSKQSIWNRDYEYGSGVSKVSPWNVYAGQPPAIVDMEGKFYGLFTNNDIQQQRFTNNFIATLFLYQDQIRQDPKTWFSRVFAPQMADHVSVVTLNELEAFPKPVPPGEIDDSRIIPLNAGEGGLSAQQKRMLAEKQAQAVLQAERAQSQLLSRAQALNSNKGPSNQSDQSINRSNNLTQEQVQQAQIRQAEEMRAQAQYNKSNNNSQYTSPQYQQAQPQNVQQNAQQYNQRAVQQQNSPYQQNAQQYNQRAVQQQSSQYQQNAQQSNQRATQQQNAQYQQNAQQYQQAPQQYQQPIQQYQQQSQQYQQQSRQNAQQYNNQRGQNYQQVAQQPVQQNYNTGNNTNYQQQNTRNVQRQNMDNSYQTQNSDYGTYR